MSDQHWRRVVAFVVFMAIPTAAVQPSDHCVAPQDPVWQEVHGYDLYAGVNDPKVPPKRYGAVMVADMGSLVMHGGYLYDRLKMKAMWLTGDWWLAPTHGRNLNEDVRPNEFAWTQFRVHGAMHRDARYKAASTTVHLTAPRSLRLLVVFGGGTSDGIATLGDMMMMDLDTGATSRVALAAAYQDVPSARISAGLVAIRDATVVLYGGVGDEGALDPTVYVGTVTVSSDGMSDVTCRWRRLKTSATRASGTPQPRRGHVMCPLRNTSGESDAIVVFGGFGRAPVRNFNDVWLLQPASEDGAGSWLWHQLHDGKTSASPFPRGGAVGAVHNEHLFVAMGAACSIACTTMSDVWVFSVTSRSWREVVQQVHARLPSPMSRQFASAAFVAPHWLYVFGGESFQPHAYWNDLWRLRLDTTGSVVTCPALIFPRDPPGDWNPPVRAPLMEPPHRSITDARYRHSRLTPGQLDTSLIFAVFAFVLVFMYCKYSRRHLRL